MKIRMKAEGGVDVGPSDLKFEIRKGNALLGTLTLSQGTLDWRPANAKRGKKGECQLSWPQFDRLLRAFQAGALYEDADLDRLQIDRPERISITQMLKASYRAALRRR